MTPAAQHHGRRRGEVVSRGTSPLRHSCGAPTPGQTVKPHCRRSTSRIMNIVWVSVIRKSNGQPSDRIADWMPTGCWLRAKIRPAKYPRDQHRRERVPRSATTFGAGPGGCAQNHHGGGSTCVSFEQVAGPAVGPDANAPRVPHGSSLPSWSCEFDFSSPAPGVAKRPQRLASSLARQKVNLSARGPVLNRESAGQGLFAVARALFTS